MGTHDDQVMRATEARLKTHEVEVPDFAQARVAARIQGQLRRPLLGWGHFGLIACATALMFAVKYAGQVDAPVAEAPVAPVSSWLAQGAVSKVGPAQVKVAKGAEVEIAEMASQPVLRLWKGTAEFDVAVLDTPLQFEVQTRQARVQGFGAKFSVQADATTTFVEVTEGKVKVLTQGETQTLSAGRRIRIGPPLAVSRKAARAPESAVHRALSVKKPRASQVHLKDVRKMLGHDAVKAGELAQQVIQAEPADPVRLEALLLLADARRRSGRDEDAVDAYRAILDHPERRAFEEEARYQLAHLLHGLGRASEAISELKVAHRLDSEGALGPERCALWASILFKSGDVLGAARVLEDAPRGWSRVLDAQRLLVAEALLAAAPARAAKLAAEVVAGAHAPDLVRVAEKVIYTARKTEASSTVRQPIQEP